MNRAEKQKLAEWLTEIADKLATAEEQALSAALDDQRRWLEDHPNSQNSHYPHMVGALGHVTCSSAESIRAAIRAYLTPKVTK